MRVEVESAAREALLDAAAGRHPASRGATAMAGEHARCEVPATVAMLPPQSPNDVKAGPFLYLTNGLC
jgi:hypothetical protein